jgi:hypothetical protein
VPHQCSSSQPCEGACPSLQIEYYDDKRCPPLVQAAKLRRMEKPIAVMVENA